MEGSPSTHRDGFEVENREADSFILSTSSCGARRPHAASAVSCLKLLALAFPALLLCSSVRAEAPTIEPLRDGLQGAGCVYAIDEGGAAMFVVDARSPPDDIKSIARIRIDGVEYVLDRSNAESSDNPTWSRGDVLVRIEEVVEGASPCAPSSSECEGTRFTAQLKLSTRGTQVHVSVHGHCGA